MNRLCPLLTRMSARSPLWRSCSLCVAELTTACCHLERGRRPKSRDLASSAAQRLDGCKTRLSNTLCIPLLHLEAFGRVQARFLVAHEIAQSLWSHKAPLGMTGPPITINQARNEHKSSRTSSLCVAELTRACCHLERGHRPKSRDLASSAAQRLDGCKTRLSNTLCIPLLHLEAFGRVQARSLV